MPIDAFLATDPQSLPKLDKMLAGLPDQVADPVVEGVADYLISVFQAYPPYQHIPRAQAFPDAVITTPRGKRIPGYFSWKQFQFVMIAISKGTINPGKPHRTQSFRKGWKKIGQGRNLIIANEVPYGPFLKGPGEQSRMMIMEGWQDINTDTASRQQRINEVAQGALKKALKSLKLG